MRIRWVRFKTRLMARRTTLIVRDLRLDMYIGIFDADKSVKHPLLINLEVDVDLPDDWQADSYAQVLGYDKLADMIRTLASEKHIHLVETLGELIAEKCFAWPQVLSVKVRIEKPVMFDDCIVGIEMHRFR